MASGAREIPLRPTKDAYYLDIARAVSRRSTCLRRHYGAVVVANDEIIATGYNGAARGQANCCDLRRCNREGCEHNDGNYGSCPAVHAEMNALLSAARSETIGATLYLAGYDFEEGRQIYGWEIEPCPVCARMIANAGIEAVVTEPR